MKFRWPWRMNWTRAAWFAGGLLAIAIVCLLFVAYGNRPSPSNSLSPGRPTEGDSQALRLTRGKTFYMQTCTICHGPNGQGRPHQGADLRLSKFVAGESDDALVNFLRKGRQPNDPKTVQGLVMPPLGGNPSLDDAALSDIVLFLRQMQSAARAEQVPGELGRAADGP
jgi:mono/diheme cytochrome c family protein